jgi:hypothetical protein
MKVKLRQTTLVLTYTFLCPFFADVLKLLVGRTPKQKQYANSRTDGVGSLKTIISMNQRKKIKETELDKQSWDKVKQEK